MTNLRTNTATETLDGSGWMGSMRAGSVSGRCSIDCGSSVFRAVARSAGLAPDVPRRDRLYESLLELDRDAAKRALAAVERVFELLAYSPFSCRRALLQKTPAGERF